VLYVSSLPVEKNIVEGVTRKARALHDAFALVSSSRSTVSVHNASSTSLDEPDASVDYVFTDPPFGDYIPYSEINQVNELWLNRRTDDTQEAIVSGAQGKTVSHYAALMAKVFSEIDRVLKPAGSASVVFHSAKASVWSALQSAYVAAGLHVAATSVLDKLQTSFKQVVSTVSVKGDPLLLLTKSESVPAAVPADDRWLVASLLARARKGTDPAEQEPHRLYSRYVAGCLERGKQVGMNAQAFYALVEQASAQ